MMKSQLSSLKHKKIVQKIFKTYSPPNHQLQLQYTEEFKNRPLNTLIKNVHSKFPDLNRFPLYYFQNVTKYSFFSGYSLQPNNLNIVHRQLKQIRNLQRLDITIQV